MSRTELDLAIGWARDEGWNPGLHDATPFHAADPEGFLVGVLDGRPISSISVVRYGETFGFLGFYIVIPEQRGRGYGFGCGRRAWPGSPGGWWASTGCRPSRTTTGDRVSSSRIATSATAARRRRAGPAAFVDARTVPFEQLLAFDARLFPAPRPGFLAGWISLPESRALAAVEDGELRGFGVRRRCGNGHKIGPLYATSRAIAERLFDGLCEGIAGEPVFLDVPEPNAEAVALAEGRDLEPAFETARMYTGPAPAIELTQLYGVTTFELG